MTKNASVGGFETTYQKYRAQLKGFISKQISSEETVEDLLQNVFYKFFVTSQAETIQSASAWLYGVARNMITDHFRKKSETPMPYFSVDSEEESELSLADLLLIETQMPEDELMRTIIWDELQMALSELPHEQRVVFELTELEGASFKEISEATQTPINTLISRKRYAVLHLRKRLQPLYQAVE